MNDFEKKQIELLEKMKDDFDFVKSNVKSITSIVIFYFVLTLVSLLFSIMYLISIYTT